ncbi:reverse transcriptase domain-containing protein [Tanacetum coccineum]
MDVVTLNPSCKVRSRGSDFDIPVVFLFDFALLRNKVMLLPILVLGCFSWILLQRYFSTSEQQRYEREYGSIYQLDRENYGEYMERWGIHGEVAAAARNIELLHESGNSNKRDRDGNRIQNRGQGQQENKGRHDQGQHEYRGRQDQSVEHRGRQDRGYDSRRQDFRGQDQRFNGRNGNDRQGQEEVSTEDFAPPHSLIVPWLQKRICQQILRRLLLYGDQLCYGLHVIGDKGLQVSLYGNLYIDDRTVFVLFDTGATHSIISTTFAKKLNMNPTPLIERVIISTPMKNHMLIDHEYVNCPLRFDDRIRPANLLPINMLDFDVILGMDCKSLSLVILYLQTDHYGSSKVEVSPNGRDTTVTEVEKFSGGGRSRYSPPPNPSLAYFVCWLLPRFVECFSD